MSAIVLDDDEEVYRTESFDPGAGDTTRLVIMGMAPGFKRLASAAIDATGTVKGLSAMISRMQDQLAAFQRKNRERRRKFARRRGPYPFARGK